MTLKINRLNTTILYSMYLINIGDDIEYMKMYSDIREAQVKLKKDILI